MASKAGDRTPIAMSHLLRLGMLNHEAQIPPLADRLALELAAEQRSAVVVLLFRKGVTPVCRVRQMLASRSEKARSKLSSAFTESSFPRSLVTSEHCLHPLSS